MSLQKVNNRTPRGCVLRLIFIIAIDHISNLNRSEDYSRGFSVAKCQVLRNCLPVPKPACHTSEFTVNRGVPQVSASGVASENERC